ncbi:MAG: hypothetical protein EXS63_01360 [Candidatus Omnitrophica bacterium]|nr:hypothetical protein [Candidatus Omnitrophota bacterium]
MFQIKATTKSQAPNPKCHPERSEGSRSKTLRGVHPEILSVKQRWTDPSSGGHFVQDDKRRSQRDGGLVDALLILNIFILLLVWNLELGAWNLYAASDQTPSCTQCFLENQKSLLRHLQRAESAYAEYRWTEAKICRLHYEPLWLSRVHENDPLDQIKRDKGRNDEGRLLLLLASYEKRSARLVNRVLTNLQTIKNSENNFGKCHSNPLVKECAQTILQKITDEIQVFQINFDHALESDRDERKAVSLTSGGPQGLYPQDSLEKPSAHSNYYSRFETDRKSKRFAEDQLSMESFEKIRRIITDDQAFSDCCYQTEKMPLAQQMETMHD